MSQASIGTGNTLRRAFFIWAVILSLVFGLLFIGVTAFTIGMWLANQNALTTPVSDLSFFALGAIIIGIGFAIYLRAPERKIAGVQRAVLGILALLVAGLIGNRIEPFVGSLNGGLVYLSDEYMAATTAAQHTAFATAAEGLIAVSNAVNAAGILTALGILILSLVMLKGVFPKGAAYLGIVTGALGIVSEAFRPIIGPGYFVYGILLPIWFLAVGWKLYRLGSSSSHSREAKQLEAGVAP